MSWLVRCPWRVFDTPANRDQRALVAKIEGPLGETGTLCGGALITLGMCGHTASGGRGDGVHGLLP